MSYRILITGASIAGNTAAWWLSYHGFDVTVTERAPVFRDGGQNIDVRGVGREVLRRMNLEHAASEQGTGEKGIRWLDERGRVAAQIVTSDLSGDGPTAEMEILRGDLARLLFDAISSDVTYRFDEHVEHIEDGAHNAKVVFASGGAEHFDLIIVAEGVGSSTRELIFPGENKPRWMDLSFAYFTIPCSPDDDPFWRWYHMSRGRSVHLRPDRHGTTRAMLTLQQTSRGEENWDIDRQKAWLRQRFVDVGGPAPRVLAGMEHAVDFYVDALRQVRMPRWSKGHVVLTGDAAWCATPLAGIGTTLALTGAYVLAGEMKQARDLRTALVAYERVMRRMVEDAQGVPKIVPRLMNPRTRFGIGVLHKVLHMACSPAFLGVAERLFDRPRTEPALARYES